MIKETYNYEVKALCRKKIKDFIYLIIPNQKNRSKLKVLTLLGHENFELEQIWDPLGILRENITNVEYNKKVLELTGNKGVNNIYGNLEEIIKTIKGTFNIINLDMQSPFTKAQRNILRNIAGRQLLGERGILATNYLGQREGGHNKEWFLATVKMLKDYEINSKDTELPEVVKFNGDERIEQRSDIISRCITVIMDEGVLHFHRHPLMEGLKDYDDFIKDYIKNILPEDWESRKSESFENLDMAIGELYLKRFFEGLIRRSNEQYIKKEEYFYKQFFKYQKIGAYFSVAQKRYRYVGDNGSPMLTDINYFKQLNFEEVAEVGKKLINNKPYFYIKDNRVGFNKSECKRVIADYRGGRLRCLKDGPEPREFLGSSYKPRLIQKKSRIKKDDAIYLLREGVPTEEILETYSGFSKMQLAAFKAHLTMGSYEPN